MERLPVKTPLGKLISLEIYHYFDGPKLFSCINTAGQRYLVFWLGDEDGKDKWLYVPLSETRLQLARSGGISLRNVCLNPEDDYLWLIDLSTDSDIPTRAEAILPVQLPPSDLPAEGSFLTFKTQTLPSIEETVTLRAKRTRCEIIDLALKPEGALRNEIATRTLGTALVNTQDLLESVVYARAGYKSRQGRPPTHLRKAAQIYAVGVFPSSFGIRLESRRVNMFGDSDLRPAIEDLFKLISAGMDRDKLKTLLTELGGRVAARYTVLLGSLANNSTDLKATWASPKYPEKTEAIAITWKEAQSTRDILLTTIDEFTETFKISCRLDGIDLHTKTFDLVNLETNERLSGRVLDSFIEAAKLAAARVPASYVATLEQHQEVITITSETKEKYSLVMLEER